MLLVPNRGEKCLGLGGSSGWVAPNGTTPRWVDPPSLRNLVCDADYPLSHYSSRQASSSHKELTNMERGFTAPSWTREIP